MIEVSLWSPKWPSITPTSAKEYLKNKPKFLVTRNKLIQSPQNMFAPFGDQEFCAIVDDIIKKTKLKKNGIQEKILWLEQSKLDKEPQQIEAINKQITVLKKEKNNLFKDVKFEIFNEKIAPRIYNNRQITFKEIHELIGSLANSAKPTKEVIDEFAELANEELLEDLAGYKEYEEYKDEILMIMDDLIDIYFDKGTWFSINEGEQKDFGQQALGIFIAKHKAEIDEWKIDEKKLNTYLHHKKVL